MDDSTTHPRDTTINAEAKARMEAAIARQDRRFENEAAWCWEEIAQLNAAVRLLQKPA